MSETEDGKRPTALKKDNLQNGFEDVLNLFSVSFLSMIFGTGVAIILYVGGFMPSYISVLVGMASAGYISVTVFMAFERKELARREVERLR